MRNDTADRREFRRIRIDKVPDLPRQFLPVARIKTSCNCRLTNHSRYSMTYTTTPVTETYIQMGKLQRAMRTCPRNRFDRPRNAVRRTMGTMTTASTVWVRSNGKYTLRIQPCFVKRTVP